MPLCYDEIDMNAHQGKYTQQLLSLPILENVDDLSHALRLPKEVILKFSFNNSTYREPTKRIKSDTAMGPKNYLR